MVSAVQAHAQTIDILVSEKATLQTELSTVKAQLSAKTSKISVSMGYGSLLVLSSVLVIDSCPLILYLL